MKMDSVEYKYLEDQRKVEYVEERLKNFLFPIEFSSDLIKPFLKKAGDTLYYERNRTPMHPEFKEFLGNDPFNINDYAGKTAAIQYFVWQWRRKIPKVTETNWNIRIEF